MRQIMLLAAIAAALGIASQPAEARDRGVGFRHFSGHAGPKLHLRHDGLKFRDGGSLGNPRPFTSRHFGHFADRGSGFKSGHVRHFKPRHFGRGGVVLKFRDRDFVLELGHMPHFKRGRFGQRHHDQGLFFGFDRQRHLRRWHDRGFAFGGDGGFTRRHQGMPGPRAGSGGGLHRRAPPEALLRQLEQMGFRHVPELLRSRNP